MISDYHRNYKAASGQRTSSSPMSLDRAPAKGASGRLKRRGSARVKSALKLQRLPARRRSEFLGCDLPRVRACGALLWEIGVAGRNAANCAQSILWIFSERILNEGSHPLALASRRQKQRGPQCAISLAALVPLV
jgi:hypothetical protein